MYTRVLALAATMLIVVLAGATSVFGKTASGGGAGGVEAKVLDQIAERGSTTFWVVLRDKADLRAAPSIENRTSRGEFVYGELRKTANRSQAGLRALLARRGADYKPFWILNAIRVTGDQALLDVLAGAAGSRAGSSPPTSSASRSRSAGRPRRESMPSSGALTGSAPRLSGRPSPTAARGSSLPTSTRGCSSTTPLSSGSTAATRAAAPSTTTTTGPTPRRCAAARRSSRATTTAMGRTPWARWSARTPAL